MEKSTKPLRSKAYKEQLAGNASGISRQLLPNTHKQPNLITLPFNQKLLKNPVFVLVHGINDTSHKFKSMQTAFEQKGYHCIVPSLTPKNGSMGLEFLALQLKDIIDAETEVMEPFICLVAFSMGGLVARYYLQELGGNQSVSLFFSISTPHHGSLLAYLSTQNKGAIQMRPNSEFLTLLDQNSANLKNIPCFSYWTPWDLMILPATSSVWDKAENIRVNCLCHPLMVRNGCIIGDIIVKVKRCIPSNPKYA